MLNSMNHFVVNPSLDPPLILPKEGEEEVDHDEVQEAVATLVHTAFEPPRRRHAREWWSNLDRFAKSLGTALEESEITSEEAQTLIEIYVGNMVEATVQEYVSNILGGTLEHGFWASHSQRQSGSLLGFWAEEMED